MWPTFWRLIPRPGSTFPHAVLPWGVPNTRFFTPPFQHWHCPGQAMLRTPSGSDTNSDSTSFENMDTASPRSVGQAKKRTDRVLTPVETGTKQKRIGSTESFSCEQHGHSGFHQQDRHRSRERYASEIRQKVRRYRQWEYTKLGRLNASSAAARRDKDVSFSLMSYNILAQGLLVDNAFLYSHCSSEVLQWEHRRRNLLQEITNADADIVCLQEVQDDHFAEVFKPELEKQGYSCIYKCRTGDKHDGCGIFFRNSVFELDRFETVEFARSGVSVLDRDNVGIIALLKPKKASQSSQDLRLCVSTTHLLFNPRRGDIKLAQLCLLLAEIDRIAFRGMDSQNRPLYSPIILCGDMNSEPHSPLYSFVTQGTLQYAGLLSGDISGQGEGANRGRTIPLHECLRELDITDRSQYRSLTASRSKVSAEAEMKDVEKTKVLKDDCRVVNKADGEGPADPPEAERLNGKVEQGSAEIGLHQKDAGNHGNDEGSGLVHHELNFVSAYRHVKRGSTPEVTTHHQRASCTVDYIFYSVLKKNTERRDNRVVQTNISEGPLKLLGTYGLMSEKELESVHGLPNEVQSSDHLALIARFMLRLPR
ncbi:protein angel homolog 2-like isoform X2 [Ornithodoros turicata]